MDKSEMGQLIRNWAERYDEIMLPAMTHANRQIRLQKDLYSRLQEIHLKPTQNIDEFVKTATDIRNMIEELSEVLSDTGEDTLKISKLLQDTINLASAAVDLIPTDAE